MSNAPTRPNDRVIRTPTQPTPDADSRPLEAVIVEREGGPDRCTIGPQECTKSERATAWLSANLTVFVDLEAAR